MYNSWFSCENQELHVGWTPLNWMGTTQHSVFIRGSITLGETIPNNARMSNRTDLNLGEVIYISIIFYIPQAFLVTIFFPCRDTTNQPYAALCIVNRIISSAILNQ